MKKKQISTLSKMTVIAFLITLQSLHAQVCPPNVILENDTSLCENTNITLNINPILLPALRPIKTPTTQGTLVYWSTGDTTYSITVAPSQTTTYYVSVSDGAGGSCIDSMTVTIVPPLTNLTYTTTVICGGIPVLMYAPPASFHQWYRNGVAINGATGLLYSAGQGGSYYCELINACGRYNTVTLPLTYSAPPTLAVSSSGSTYICPNSSITLTSTTNSTNPSYQWLRNNVNIPNEVTSTLIVNNGGTYRLKITNNTTGCSRTSSGLTVKKSNLTASFIANPCNAGAVVMNASTNGILPLYQWIRNNVPIGTNSSQYITNTNGFFKVIVTDSFGCTKASTGQQIIRNCRIGDYGSLNEISIYPNPAQDVLNLESPNFEPLQINIYNVLGTLLFTKPWQTQLQIEELHTGIYFLEILDENKQILKRIKFQKTD